MKLWRIIWALYVLVLWGLPCESFCQDKPSTKQTSRSDDHSRDTGCSPFCLCATCPGGTLPPAPQSIGVIISSAPLILAVLPLYQTPHAFDVPGWIWQPPLLS